MASPGRDTAAALQAAIGNQALQRHAHLTLGPGHPLDPATRAVFESQLGQDFRAVRVHTDGRAANSARNLDARAYTFGHDIVFAPTRTGPARSPGSVFWFTSWCMSRNNAAPRPPVH
jgi:hypothetical protein